jgi:hypothetical protein
VELKVSGVIGMLYYTRWGEGEVRREIDDCCCPTGWRRGEEVFAVSIGADGMVQRGVGDFHT